MKLISRTKGSDLGRELEITNEDTARRIEEKKGWKEEEIENEGMVYSVGESRQGGWRRLIWHNSIDVWWNRDVSRVTAVDVTESRQSADWHNSGHVLPRRQQSTCLPHE
jgi:hypothetical protein